MIIERPLVLLRGSSGISPNDGACKVGADALDGVALRLVEEVRVMPRCAVAGISISGSLGLRKRRVLLCRLRKKAKVRVWRRRSL